MARFGRGLFRAGAAPVHFQAQETLSQKAIGFHARIAEFLLVNRLKARLRRHDGEQIMERAAQIVAVTCKNWFLAPDGKAPERRTPL
jgi:hypothetical protein